MNHLESQLDYPFGDTLPALGAVHAIAPGLDWLRMPLPFALDHINLWLLGDELDGRSRSRRGREYCAAKRGTAELSDSI